MSRLVRFVEVDKYENDYLRKVQEVQETRRRLEYEGWVFVPRLNGVLVKFYRTPGTVEFWRRRIIDLIPRMKRL